MTRLNTPTSHAIANHLESDPVKLVVGVCERCGPARPIRVFMGVRQCGHCGAVQDNTAE